MQLNTLLKNVPVLRTNVPPETDVTTVQLLLNQRHRMTLDILRFDMFQFDFHDVLLLPGRARDFR